ncbi:dihydrodipicolinate synthase family protein [Parapedobacter tibetensis]|uniref:dihydrodipicolinate synthase family protein n=1 Tax=Parapedobacter tibetensis TaxID=2972951 RepID=UPI00214D9905|nr:dihydrodipicolinate synthase family protein [Parapedobacter tibetensis]
MAAQTGFSAAKRAILKQGTVIPAHPLALTSERKLDEANQRLLTRYYLAAGAGGVAVGVHSTQFAIRDPGINLYEPVLALAAEEITAAGTGDRFISVAGLCGNTEQALREAELALRYGYDMGLLSMGGLQGKTEAEILERARAVAAVIPVFGFYLQPSVGGRVFSYDFWLEFAEIPNVQAIKAAPFNRYQTLELVRAVCHASRGEEIALYTGNDDNIVADLLTTYTFDVRGKKVSKRFEGGLLGHWAVWTHAAVALLKEVKRCRDNGYADMDELLAKGVAVTDMNAAIFDPAHDFHGCIPGIHDVLRRQGLMDGIWCLDPDERLSPGQADEITRVCQAYPDLTDDAFVTDFLVRQR